jgi:hypothetical protein
LSSLWLACLTKNRTVWICDWKLRLEFSPRYHERNEMSLLIQQIPDRTHLLFFYKIVFIKDKNTNKPILIANYLIEIHKPWLSEVYNFIIEFFLKTHVYDSFFLIIPHATDFFPVCVNCTSYHFSNLYYIY